MTRPNAELAYRVLDHIDAHPEQWDQRLWYAQTECGIAGCFAGWTVVLAGHQVEVEDEPDGRGWRYLQTIDDADDVPVSRVAEVDLGISDLRMPCSLGCDDCGYTARAAAKLFAPDSDRDDLGRLVAEIFGPRPAGEPS